MRTNRVFQPGGDGASVVSILLFLGFLLFALMLSGEVRVRRPRAPARADLGAIVAPRAHDHETPLGQEWVEFHLPATLGKQASDALRQSGGLSTAPLAPKGLLSGAAARLA